MVDIGSYKDQVTYTDDQAIIPDELVAKCQAIATERKDSSSSWPLKPCRFGGRPW